MEHLAPAQRCVAYMQIGRVAEALDIFSDMTDAIVPMVNMRDHAANDDFDRVRWLANHPNMPQRQWLIGQVDHMAQDFTDLQGEIITGTAQANDLDNFAQQLNWFVGAFQHLGPQFLVENQGFMQAEEDERRDVLQARFRDPMDDEDDNAPTPPRIRFRLVRNRSGGLY